MVFLWDKLMEFDIKVISIVAGHADKDWFPSSSHYPEGLLIIANSTHMQDILGVVYDLFMLGTISPHPYLYKHMYHFPIRPCAYYYSQIKQMLGLEDNQFLPKMLSSPYTSLRR